MIGIAHPALGEEVAAAVALKPDADVTTDELATSSSARVAAYKYPHELWLAAELPKRPDRQGPQARDRGSHP